MTRAIGVGVFVAIAVACVALDLFNRRPTSRGPNFTQLLSWLQARPVGQIVVLVTWGFTGWHFFVR
jgi:hypothetical protein